MAEDNPVDTPKRKRGRPPKPDSEKVTPKRKAESEGASAPKRGRGRPKGSKNKGSVAKKPAAKGTVRGVRCLLQWDGCVGFICMESWDYCFIIILRGWFHVYIS